MEIKRAKAYINGEYWKDIDVISNTFTTMGPVFYENLIGVEPKQLTFNKTSNNPLRYDCLDDDIKLVKILVRNKS